MRRIRPDGASFVKKSFTWETPRRTCAGSDKSHVTWRNLSFESFMSGLRRDKLQNESSGQSFPNSSMNDFPIPEDPPVITTAENCLRAASGDGMTLKGLIFSQRGRYP
jgi:hypothetical protein